MKHIARSYNVAAIFAATFVLATSLFSVQSSHAQPVFDPDRFPDPREQILVDLNGDGTPDRVLVYALNRSYDILTYELGFGSGSFDEREAFVVPVNMSDSDSLGLSGTGNVVLTWGCFACGRYHSQTSVTLRLENDRFQVIGYDHTHADRIYAAVFSCSVNFITGDAVIEADDIERLTRSTPERSQPLRNYAWQAAPRACDVLDKYDDAFKERHFGARR